MITSFKARMPILGPRFAHQPDAFRGSITFENQVNAHSKQPNAARAIRLALRARDGN
jgi:hypothetical protein